MKNVEIINIMCYNISRNYKECIIRMKNKNFKFNIKKMLIIAFAVYAICTFFSQQKSLDAYKADSDRYLEQIATEKEKKEELEQTKANINSNEYIEEVARERLDMYLPNEKVYIDISK